MSGKLASLACSNLLPTLSGEKLLDCCKDLSLLHLPPGHASATNVLDSVKTLVMGDPSQSIPPLEMDEEKLAQVAECLARLASQLKEPTKTEDLLQTVARRLRQDPEKTTAPANDFAQYSIPGQMSQIPEFSADTFGTLVTALSRMRPLTAATTSEFCLLMTPTLPKMPTTQLVAFVTSCHPILSSKGLSPEMCTALLKSVQMMFASAATIKALPENGYARCIEVISSLLAELPYGSPQRSQAVGMLNSICENGDKAVNGARGVGWRFVTEDLLDALPASAELVRSSLLRVDTKGVTAAPIHKSAF